MNRAEVLEILAQHRDDLAKRYGVTRLGIFGSVARGEEILNQRLKAQSNERGGNRYAEPAAKEPVLYSTPPYIMKGEQTWNG